MNICQTKELTKIIDKETGEEMIVTLRYDDQCGNQHNTFSITTENGCDHDGIRKHFPELEKYIPWHLCSSDGPMHYVQNTLWAAGNRDCWGKAAGEVSRTEKSITFGSFPIVYKIEDSFWKFLKRGADNFDFGVLQIDNGKDRKTFGPKYTFGGYADEWYQCPFHTEDEALQFLDALQNHKPSFTETPTAWSEGKIRGFNSARYHAIWPEATDEELSVSKGELTKALEARLPALLVRFKVAMEELGFTY